MSWTDWVCLGVFLIGFLMFLYAANTYNAFIGYTGLFLFFGAIIAYLVIYVYHELTKMPDSSKTVKNTVFFI
jgi:hypothetical protein